MGEMRMKKFKSKVGWVVYEATAEDTLKLGGLGICDNCNNYSPTGYLVAILNSYLCPECYKKWDAGARFYPEDVPVEKQHIAYFDHVFKL
jgi:hypothetical protein